jgi:hypothetical protein
MLIPLSYTRINSIWIKGLNIRSEIIKLLEENMAESSTSVWVNFLDMTPKAQAMKTKIDK